MSAPSLLPVPSSTSLASVEGGDVLKKCMDRMGDKTNPEDLKAGLKMLENQVRKKEI